MSEENGQAIRKAIHAVMLEVGAIGKAGVNEEQKYAYRRIEDIYSRVQPLMAQQGILTRFFVHDKTIEKGPTSQSGKAALHAILWVTYQFISVEDGSVFELPNVPGQAIDWSDKAIGKAMTYAHKLALSQLLMIPYEEMDPDRFSPQWSEEFTGRVTLKSVNELKKAWHAQADVGPEMSKDAQLAAFTEWVSEQAGRHFDAGNWRQWRLDDLAACQEALAEGERQP